MRVCVYCSSSERIDPAYVLLAGQVGALLAERGHTLVSGGGSISCMGAVARAARAGGAHTLGVIPRKLIELEVTDTDADELIITETMRERKAIMDSRADAFLALPGGLGTLEELFEVWVAAMLGMHAKPIVVCDPDGVFAHLHTLVDGLVDQGFVRPDARALLRWATTPAEAIDFLEAAVAGPPAHPSPEEAVEAAAPPID
ncbi:TIGR00730 family Rossman fold protein [Frankia sp. CNm7]|uniref:Cytokinin riboside 5'-monophosphate phosphoribohydrolase n=1 Tax=Frankia nepalensis TaxID=1836974 RepID=A0A937RGC9_9ACTN|nr:TIGR00730 family Rossman fold protein [Frankia nepalensis]MBL7501390.1 TIGR00730 family Rossman fold protein [Frankia nepalensis]MBL7511917.1 TIGR00730 family Rossman fold protein [Frankia nepalensis]MBL7517005.1 TIGR00730 family Rossman fold protein [Frankia nepalensis]MBL7628480.1 TIGR00730 family Rossman fold protein [Frankia nepalensis]